MASYRRTGGSAKQRLCHRAEHEKGDEQADAAVGYECAREHHREYCATLTQALGHEIRDSRHRTAVVHEFAEDGAEKKNRKELSQEAGSAAHEDLRPIGE
jgi:hypothetical protein